MALKGTQQRPTVVVDAHSQTADQSSTARLAAWQRQYPSPQESPDADASTRELKMAYRPPRNDVKGVAIACGIILAWALLFHHALWRVRLSDAPDGSSRRSSALEIVAVFVLLEFVNTGLFITCHDSMHGCICFKNRKLNDLLGRVAITAYAYFDYDMLHKKHWEHHNFTGQPGKDPDFHRGNMNVVVWFARFMWEYSTLLQFAKIFLASSVLQALGAPYANLCVYMAAAPLVAAVRLFVFGTYLPHLPPDSHTAMPWQRSHSSDAPAWLTFLTCYNFGLHFEHHKFPWAPWWELPKAKAITNEWKAKQARLRAPQQQQQEEEDEQQQHQQPRLPSLAASQAEARPVAAH